MQTNSKYVNDGEIYGGVKVDGEFIIRAIKAVVKETSMFK